jgi:hypothetical protein
MDGFRFDALTRRWLAFLTARQFLFTVPLGTLALGLGTGTGRAGPGCKNVGKKCRKQKDCCSGVCKGKKGKKKCKAHDSSGCVAGQGLINCPGNPTDDCVSSKGFNGNCWTTTGNSGYCGSVGACVACTRDADCRVFCGPDAACVHCAQCSNPERTACMGTEACNFAP